MVCICRYFAKSHLLISQYSSRNFCMFVCAIYLYYLSSMEEKSRHAESKHHATRSVTLDVFAIDGGTYHTNSLSCAYVDEWDFLSMFSWCFTDTLELSGLLKAVVAETRPRLRTG